MRNIDLGCLRLLIVPSWAFYFYKVATQAVIAQGTQALSYEATCTPASRL